MNFLLCSIFWSIFIYGLLEIIKNIIYFFTYTEVKQNGINLVLTVKNEEENIEGIIRSIIFRIIYGKEEYLNKIIIADMGSNDDTLKILKKLENEYEELEVMSWFECKEIIDNIERIKKED